MSKTPAAPSLKHIAQEAGVSVSLVSKVLNNRLGNTGVTEAVAERIHRISREMGYRKNHSAESLRTGRHNAIGVMLHRHGEAGSGLTQQVMIGIAESARKKGQKLILSFFEKDSEFLEMSKSAHRGMMDGLILGGAMHPGLQGRILEIQQRGVPVVSVFDAPIHPDILNVGMDQTQVTELATRHLLDRGCQTVGTIVSHPERHKGYRRELEKAGLPVEEKWLRSAGQFEYSYQAGEQAVRHWLENGGPPEGIVCESDAQAMGTINTLRDEGIRVPGDVKVTGIDNSAYCEYVRPSITSISQEHPVRGRMAMDMIMEVSNGGSVRHAEIPPQLIARASSTA